VQAAVRGLHLIYKLGYNFAKASVHPADFQSADIEQGELALDAGIVNRSALMAAMDKINATFGKHSLWVASAGTKGAKREWEIRQIYVPHCTPRIFEKFQRHWRDNANKTVVEVSLCRKTSRESPALLVEIREEQAGLECIKTLFENHPITNLNLKM
jgi:hypothetical protein